MNFHNNIQILTEILIDFNKNPLQTTNFRSNANRLNVQKQKKPAVKLTFHDGGGILVRP